MQRLVIGGGVIIGIAAYNNSALQCVSRALTEGSEGVAGGLGVITVCETHANTPFSG
jgi:hypothetical protein